VRNGWIKYFIIMEMHFVANLYIMDLMSKCISVKQTRFQVNSANVKVFVMRLCVCNRIQVQLKVSVNISCFPQYAGWEWNVKSQIVHWSYCVPLYVACASASAAWSRHKQYERSEMKLRMIINIIQCWIIRPSWM
jgi:hypothetical protein